MNFIVTLSDKLKLAKHGTYACLRQLPVVCSFYIKEKITKAINERKIIGYYWKKCLSLFGWKKKKKT